MGAAAAGGGSGASVIDPKWLVCDVEKPEPSAAGKMLVHVTAYVEAGTARDDEKVRPRRCSIGGCWPAADGAACSPLALRVRR
jgi:hypothetical protein